MKPWRIGQVCGYVEVPAAVAAAAADVAAAFFSTSKSVEFCNDPVDEVWDEAHLPPFNEWFPSDEVRALGFEPAIDADGTRVQILATIGIDRHVDEMSGYVLAWVLCNDGLRFKQGGSSHVTKPGEWFIFDDFLPHEVIDRKKSTVYMFVHVPVRSSGRG